MLTNVLMGVLCFLALVVIVICTLVCGKNEGGAGSAFGGGAQDTYFNRGGAKGKDYRLQQVMKICSALLVILSIVMVFLQK